MKIIKILFLSFIVPLSSLAQKDYEIFEKGIKEEIEMLTNFLRTLRGSETVQFDPDSLSGEIADQLTNFLNSDSGYLFNLKDFPNILEEYCVFQKDNINIQVIGFNYHCGGTAGTIYHPIVIRNPNQQSQKAYDLSYTEYGISEIYHLGGERFLCFGIVPGSGTCIAERVSIIEFSGNDISLLKVFDGEEKFVICNAELSFDTETKLLTIEVYMFPTYSEDCEGMFLYEPVKCFHIECDDEYKVASLHARFDGEKFVKP